jgi:hypothetical protein
VKRREAAATIACRSDQPSSAVVARGMSDALATVFNCNRLNKSTIVFHRRFGEDLDYSIVVQQLQCISSPGTAIVNATIAKSTSSGGDQNIITVIAAAVA